MRAWSWLLSLFVLVGCSASHLNDGDGGSRDAGSADDASLALTASSWIVTASLSLAAEPGPVPPTMPSEHRFTIALTPTREGAEGIAGTFGDTAIFTFSGGDGLRLSAPASLAIEDHSPCPGVGPLQYRAMELELHDAGGDGEPDRLTGTASGSMMIASGDVVWETSFTATLSGVRDHEPPSLELLASNDVLPVDGVTLRANEPLPAGTSIALVPSSGDAVTLVPLRAEDRDATYTTPGDALLAWGTEYAIAVTPELIDLAGNVRASVPAVYTAADPGIQPEDGFETALQARLSSGAALVDAADGAHVIAGSRSLIIPPTGGGRITMRLAVPPGATALHARYRLLAEQANGGWFFGSIAIRAAGAPATSASIAGSSEGEPWEGSGIASAPYMSQEALLDAPLPEGASGDVVLDIQAGPFTCAGPLPVLAGIMIDDVRVE